MENKNEGDSTAENVVEGPSKGIGIAELAASIQASKVPVSQEDESETEPEQEEVVENNQSTESSKLSDAIENETQSQEDDTDGEDQDYDYDDSDDDESEDNDVLSKKKFDKAINKLRKRIDKTTKNWRTAEEKLESKEQTIEELQSELEKYKSGYAPKNEPQGLAHKVKTAESVEDLVKIKETAETVIEKADDLIFELEESGDSEIEFNGRTFTKAELRDTKKEAEETIKKHITNKAQLFEQRQQFDQAALETFDFLKDPESVGYKYAAEVMADERFNSFLNEQPEQSYVLGLIAKGRLALEQEAKAKQSREKGNSEEQVKRPASTPKIAPSVPGVTGVKKGVAPARSSADQMVKQRREEILSRNKLDTRGLAQLIAASKQ